MKKKQLLYLANVRLPTEKAHGIQIMKMCEAFTDQGWAVTLIVPRRRTPITEDPFFYYNVKRNFTIKRVPDVDLVSFGRLGYWFQALVFSLQAVAIAINSEVKIVYSRDELPLFFLGFFKKNICWEAHTSRYNFIIGWLLRNCPHVVTISRGLTNFFSAKGFARDKFAIMPDGVDLEPFSSFSVDKATLRQKLVLPLDRKIIGYIGKYKTMGLDKGVDTLIESFFQVNNICSSTFLLLVGINPSELDDIEKFFLKLGINRGSYKIVPHLSHGQVLAYLKVADVLVMNYPNQSHYAHFMSPLKLFEYLASGTPIVTTDLPVVREIVSEKEVFWVEPDNLRSLAHGILEALNNPNLAKQKAVAGKGLVANYTWFKRAGRILTFLGSKD